jgi:hypothetical protein
MDVLNRHFLLACLALQLLHGFDLFQVKPLENLVLAHNRVQSATLINEAKFGFNGSKTRVSGLAPVVPGVNLDGVSIALNGVQTLDGTPGYALPTGLLKISTAFNGRASPLAAFSAATAA